jgi:NADH-quinone oxidoreductase subunit C
MTIVLSGQEGTQIISEMFPEGVIESEPQAVVVKSNYFLKIAEFLKNGPDLAFDQLIDITSVDRYDYFEIVYRFTSLKYNRSLTLKLRCADRSHPTVPSLTGIWKGASLMEREVFDLMGIEFTGHPNMKRIFLWEGFNGHPLRKDFTGGDRNRT